MQTIKKQTLEGASLILEDNCFIDCVLRDCDLYFSGGDFEWQNTTFDNCRFHWRGAAKNTLELIRTMGLLRDLTPPKAGITKTTGFVQ
jgi:hypothetical protein